MLLIYYWAGLLKKKRWKKTKSLGDKKMLQSLQHDGLWFRAKSNAICEEIVLLRVNKVIRIISDFKMDVIKPEIRATDRDHWSFEICDRLLCWLPYPCNSLCRLHQSSKHATPDNLTMTWVNIEKSSAHPKEQYWFVESIFNFKLPYGPVEKCSI